MKKWKNKWYFSIVFMTILCSCSLLLTTQIQAKNKTVSADVPVKTVKIGKTIKIENKTKEVIFSSSNTDIAYVDKDGIITGKKEGKATITVKKESYQSKIFEITVIANGKMPSLPAVHAEIQLKDLELFPEEEGISPKMKADFYNNAKSGRVDSVEYIYEINNLVEESSDIIEPEPTVPPEGEEKIISELEKVNQSEEIQDSESTQMPESTPEVENTLQPQSTQKPEQKKETKRVILKSKGIAAGKSSSVTCEGPISGNKEDITLIEIRIYAGEGILIHNFVKDTFVYQWATEDKIPPVISGMIGKDSYNKKEIFMTAYPDKKYHFEKYVTAEDNRDIKVSVVADTSKVNWKKPGIYQIQFVAKDKAGNTTKKNAKIEVRAVNNIEKMADVILKDICKESWSDQKKAEAIYTYIRKKFSYVDSNVHQSWEVSSLYGMRYKSGNCFVYYSTARLLLTRSGIPNITITRSQGHGGHWWNLVYIKDGWYHFDTTPRKISAVFCLVTDKQLSEYSRKSGNSHIWNHSLYPKTAVKEISKIKWGQRW